jgi:hypothetical protein
MNNPSKIGKVMKEYAEGTLYSGKGKKGKKGKKVTNPKQAKAIAMSEAGMSKAMDRGVRKGLGIKD